MKFIELNDRLTDWEDFVLQNPAGNFEQTVEQYRLLKLRGKQVRIFGVIDDQNRIIAGSLVTWSAVKLGNLFNLDYGPLVQSWDGEILKTFADGLKEFAARHDGLFIKVGPHAVYQNFNDNGEAIDEPNMEVLNALQVAGFTHNKFQFGMTAAGIAPWQYIKNLTSETVDGVNKSYHKMAKQYLKKNQQFGVTLREIDRDELPMFYTITEEASERRNFDGKDLGYYQTAFDTFGKRIKFVVAEVNFNKYIQTAQAKLDDIAEKMAVLTTKRETAPNKTRIDKQLAELKKQSKNQQERITHGEKMRAEAGKNTVAVAGGMFITMPQEIVYLFSGSLEKYAEFYAMYQIQDHMIKEGIVQNIPVYNFLGIDGVFDGSDGVMTFKTQFGGQAQQMVGSFTLPVKPLKYSIYRGLKNLLHRS